MSITGDGDPFDEFFKKIMEQLNRMDNDNTDELFDDDKQEISENDNNKKSNPHFKSFGISFRQLPGQDKPDIRVNGDFNPEDLRRFQNFFKRGMFNPMVPQNGPERQPIIKIQSPDKNAREPFVDILDQDKEILVVIELPGIVKTDIELQVSDHALELEAGPYTKTIKLPAKVHDNAKARYKNGILEIRLEKTGENPKTRIQIE